MTFISIPTKCGEVSSEENLLNIRGVYLAKEAWTEQGYID